MANASLITRTFFDRRANGSAVLLTVDEWRAFGRKALGVTWRTAVRKRAAEIGGAIVWLCDDSLLVVTKLADGRLSQRTFKRGTWAFDDEMARYA